MAQVNNLIFYPIALTLVILFDDLMEPVRPSLTLWIICGILYMSFYLIRCYARKLWVFTLLHAAVSVGLLVLYSLGEAYPVGILSCMGNGVNRFCFSVATIGFTAYSVYLRFHGAAISEIMPMPVAVGVAGVALFLQHYQGHSGWDSYYTIPLILVIAMFFLHYYIKEYLNFLVVNASSTGVLPEKEIFTSGLRMTFLYTFIGSLILFATSQYTWLRNILSVLKQWIYNVIRFIFSHMPRIQSEPPIYVDDTPRDGGGFILPEAGPPSMFWKVFEVIAVTLLLVAIAICIIKAIMKVFALYRRLMDKNVKEHEHELTGIRDVREKCESSGQKKKSRKPLELFGFLDAKERIRRIYKKKAAAYKPLPLSEAEAKKKERYQPERVMYYTAREMEQEMQASPFAAVYEKARYSNEECNSQDVKLMKELCR